MTASLLNDALKNFSTANIMYMANRNLISTSGKLYLPKRVVFNTVRLYKNDITLANEAENVFILCLDGKGQIIAEVPLDKVVQRLSNSATVIFNGIRFVYCAKVIQQGKYFKLTVTLPIELKEKIEKAVDSGIFPSVDKVVEFALKRLFRRKRKYEV